MLRKVFIMLTLIISSTSIIINCESSTEPLAKGVSIDREIVADCTGNHDGITTQTELDSLNQYFLINDKGWAVGSGLTRFGDKIPPDSLRDHFLIWGPLFINETELRDFHKGIGIRTPFVGIYVLESNKNIMVVKLFRAPGPNVYSGDWQELQII
jgi:hypothetical protein